MRVPADTTVCRASFSFTCAACSHATTSRALAASGFNGASGSQASCLKESSIEISDQWNPWPLHDAQCKALAATELVLE